MKRGLRSTDSIFSQRSDTNSIYLPLTLLACLFTANYLAGFEFNLSIFILIPIGLATWHGNFRMGMAFAIFSALIWYLAHLFLSDQQPANALVPLVNTLILLALFLVASKLLEQFKTLVDIEQRKSRTDPLTGLMNKGGFNEMADRIFIQSLRHSRSTTLAYIDLDNLKRTNEEMGHSTGDKVLESIGEIFLKSSRKTDIMGRLGEDEFALILPETNRLGAKVMLNRLRGRYTEAMQNNSWPVGFSIGVITFDLPPESHEEAIKTAHTLMQKAKQTGRDNTIFDHYPQEQQSSYIILTD